MSKWLVKAKTNSWKQPLGIDADVDAEKSHRHKNEWKQNWTSKLFVAKNQKYVKILSKSLKCSSYKPYVCRNNYTRTYVEFYIE